MQIATFKTDQTSDERQHAMSTIEIGTYSYAIPHEILIAFDSSDGAQKAIAYAKSLASRFGSHVTVAHVSQPQNPIVVPEGIYLEGDVDRVAATTDAQLDEAVEELRSSGLKADRAEHWGGVSEELTNLAREKSADLLVLGTRAPHGLDRLLFGSVAEEVADRSGWPVMVVGPNVETSSGAWSLADVICVVDQTQEDVSAAVYGYHLAHEVGAAFMLLIIGEGGSEVADPTGNDLFLKALAQELPGVDLTREVQIRTIRQRVASDCVLKLVEDVRPGAIVMSAETVGPLHSHFHRDLLSDVVEEARCPVIVVAKDDRKAQG